ncbi:MAG: tetratricopeptide repeat protein, partial [Caulobacteraceae bacterium]
MSSASQSIETLLQAGLRSLQQGRVDEASDAFRAILSQAPYDATAHHLLGLAALQAGRPEEAAESLRRSIALDPADPAAHGNLGNALRNLGRADEALQAYGAALTLAPANLHVLNDRAILFTRLGRFDEALADYDRALASNPWVALLHNQRALVLRLLGRHAEALDGCAQAIRLDPRYGDARLNRATVLSELGRDEEAIADYEACLAAQPDRPEAVFYAGTTHLMLGDYERGWERYEARLGLGGIRRVAPEVDFPRPAWGGESALKGKTLLLHSEQGLGDTLQFCRYANLAKAEGAIVILQVEAPLVRLLSSLSGADRVVAKGEDLPEFDLHASIMSLPRAFRTTLQTVPAEVPYLRAEPDKVEAWDRTLSEGLGGEARPRVGLAWSGGVAAERRDLFRRNIPLGMLAPLARAPVDFVSLQKGEAEGELAALAAAGWDGPDMMNPSADLHDFSDTAALIETLDLVITVDTSVAHLAGALGKPVWILNRFDNCWRWMRGRSDSPWYPTARLFRQARFGDWAPVVEAVAEALT